MVTRRSPRLHRSLGVSQVETDDDAGMTNGAARPIPFRKGKRTGGAPSVRPRAKILRAGEVVLSGETVIPILELRRPRRAA